MTVTFSPWSFWGAKMLLCPVYFLETKNICRRELDWGLLGFFCWSKSMLADAPGWFEMTNVCTSKFGSKPGGWSWNTMQKNRKRFCTPCSLRISNIIRSTVRLKEVAALSQQPINGMKIKLYFKGGEEKTKKNNHKKNHRTNEPLFVDLPPCHTLV